jgi:hypothetical protein
LELKGGMAAQRNLKISEELELPAAEAVTQTIVVYGGKGMGKTNLAAVLAEEFAATGKRFSVLDPVGVSWGLRHSSDGRGVGLDVLILGGVHGDLAIEPTGGAVVADLVADEETDTVVDISRRADGRMWSAGEKIRFVTDYTTRLFERQGERRRPIMQIVDEAGRFVPQNPPKGALDITKCIGAIEQLVELGRNVGVGVTLITQRSARMNKSVSELAECMVAFRTVGPRSVDAILDWFGEHVQKDRWRALVEQLRSLPRGKALIVSPGWLDFEGVASIRKRHTFDSSSTPTGAERALAKRGARPDLAQYRTRLLETVEKAEASDPSKLRAKLERLQAEHAKLQAHAAHLELGVPAKGAKAERVQVLTDHDRDQIATVRNRLDQVAADLGGVAGAALQEIEKRMSAALEAFAKAYGLEVERRRKEFLELLERAKFQAILEKLAAVTPTPHPIPNATDSKRVERASSHAGRTVPGATVTRPARVVSMPRVDGETRILNPDGSLRSAARKLLTALAQAGKPLTRQQVHALAMLKPSGDTSVSFAEFLTRGWVRNQDGKVEITEAGVEALGDFEQLPTGAALREYLLNGGMRLSSAERKILAAAFTKYPRAVTRTELLDAAGLRPSGDTSVAIAKFLTLGWLENEGGGLVASQVFY